MIKQTFAIVCIVVLALNMSWAANTDDHIDEQHTHGDHDHHGHILLDEKSYQAEVQFSETIYKNKKIHQDVVSAFEDKCQACHYGFTRNKMAPPIASVQQVYLRLANNNITEAKKRMMTFLRNPKLEKTLMKPAVNLYGVMPKLGLTDREINNFTKVILDNKFTIPTWFDDHFNSHDLKANPIK